MFKWVCLVVAVAAIAGFGWMVNDVRLEITQTTTVLNERLPLILDKADRVADVADQRVPAILEKVETSVDTLNEVTEQINQIKDAWTRDHSPQRDLQLLAYSESILGALQTQPATIGVKKPIGKGLTNEKSAKVWTEGARREANFLSLFVKSKDEMRSHLSKNLVGMPWYIQFEKKEPQLLEDWILEHVEKSEE